MSSEKPDAPGHLERLDPKTAPPILAAQHYARYDWAAQFLPAARVLDCSCGLGYGSVLLAEAGAAVVVGVDISPEAIETARRRYAHRRVTYQVADAFTLAPPEFGPFDVIVSLETLEHVARPEALLDVFRGLLAPAGQLLLSVPNDTHLNVENPFHLWKAELGRVQEWLTARFAHVACYLELRPIGTLVAPREWVSEGARDSVALRHVGTLPAEHAVGFLFACGDTPARPVPPVAAQLLDGQGYLVELDQPRMRLWEEARYLADCWEEQKAYIHQQEKYAQELRAECDRLRKALEARPEP